MAISSIGLANAATTWKPFKQCNMVYRTSVDPTVYGVAGNQVTDFKLTLDGNPDTWYYLDMKSLKPDISVDPQFSFELFPFFLDQTSLEDNDAFWDYWDAKLAEPLANGQTWAYRSDHDHYLQISLDTER